jgi:hypothetical protein
MIYVTLWRLKNRYDIQNAPHREHCLYKQKLTDTLLGVNEACMLMVRDMLIVCELVKVLWETCTKENMIWQVNESG